MPSSLLSYYLRRDVQQRILEAAKDREVAIKFPNGFGKRPDVLQFPQDIAELAKRGATSFHISEERWNNPMQLATGLSKRDLDELRSGWDLLIDIDTKFIEYAKVCARLLVEAFKFHNIEHYSVKFSGGNGFHLGIPFESFPQEQGVRLEFPDRTRYIIAYLRDFIKDHLSQGLLEMSSKREIADALGKDVKAVEHPDGTFNPYAVIGLDTVLISSRHMFRAPYSINEKRGLASIPIKNIKAFTPADAKLSNVDTGLGFLDAFEPDEARELFDRAKELFAQQVRRDDLKRDQEQHFSLSGMPAAQERTFEIPKIPITEQAFFPPCVRKLLEGIPDDGKKRAVFILINFFRQMGWTLEAIQQELLAWNKKNREPLREGYILAQISWFKRQPKPTMPPNCAAEAYMKGIGVCAPDSLCHTIKNPVQYSLKRVKLLAQQRNPKRRPSSRKGKT